MLRTHFMQQQLTSSDPSMEETSFDTPQYRQFAQLDRHRRLPDENTILRFLHLQKEYKLAKKILEVVNHILIERRLLFKVST